MNDLTVINPNEPMVQVVFPQDHVDRVFPLADILMEGDSPATISDAELIARAARWLDLPIHYFANMIVTRPRTGNVLIAPKPVYGGAGTAIGIIILASIIGAIAFLLLPLFSAVAGYIIGWGLSEVFPFAGGWVVSGANAFGLDWTLATLPVAGTFIGFVAGFFRHTQKVKHEK